MSDTLFDMKTTTRSFQREFKKMKRIASEGKTVFIHDAAGQDFVFLMKRAAGNPLLGCLLGSVRGDAESPTEEIWEVAR